MFKSLREAKSKVYTWNYEAGNKMNSRFTTSEHTNARYQKLLEEGADLSNGIEMKAEIHSMRGGRTRQRTEPRCSQIQPLPRRGSRPPIWLHSVNPIGTCNHKSCGLTQWFLQMIMGLTLMGLLVALIVMFPAFTLPELGDWWKIYCPCLASILFIFKWCT